MEKYVCGYAFRNTITGKFAQKGLKHWANKPNIWLKEQYIKALITCRINEAKRYSADADTLKSAYMVCEIVEVIIDPTASKSMLFNLDWLDK